MPETIQWAPRREDAFKDWILSELETYKSESDPMRTNWQKGKRRNENPPPHNLTNRFMPMVLVWTDCPNKEFTKKHPFSSWAQSTIFYHKKFKENSSSPGQIHPPKNTKTRYNTTHPHTLRHQRHQHPATGGSAHPSEQSESMIQRGPYSHCHHSPKPHPAIPKD